MKRTLIVLGGFIAGSVLAYAAVIAQQALKRSGDSMSYEKAMEIMLVAGIAGAAAAFFWSR